MKNNWYAILSRSPHYVFLFLGVIFGLLFLILTPPFQTPDEVNHFYKAYQISEGQMISSKVDHRIGGYLPYDVVHVSDSFSPMFGRMHAKTSAEDIFGQFKKKSGKKEFVDFANTAVYSPISYLPQSIGIFIANKLGASPLLLMYVARLCSLIFWITCVFYAIRKTPIFKWLLTLLALLPMSLTVNSSVSADVTSNALAFLVITHALLLYQSEEKWTRRHWGYALCLGILLSSAKLVYIPIFLLYLLVPIRKFNSRKSYFVQLGILAGVTLSTVMVWSMIMSNSHLTYAEYNVLYRDLSNLGVCADLHAQMTYISSHLGFLFESLGNAFVYPFDMYVRGYIGTFGWIDTYLPTWTIIFSYLVIVLVALTDVTENHRFKPKHKLILLTAALLMFFLVVISQLLIWTCVGDSIVRNLQGRYFIPVFPLIFMALSVRSKRKISWMPALVVFFSVLMLVFSLTVIYDRYYVASEFNDVSFKFSANDVMEKTEFSANPPDGFSLTPHFKSSIQHISGKYGFVISRDSPYGAPMKIKNCRFGDWIKVKGDRLGTGGGIVISSEDGSFYHIEMGEEKDSSDNWVQLHASLLIHEPKFGGDFSVYLFQPEGDSSVFDNIEIVHHQFKR